jgi:1-acyl-sn-glycerol-3-phosphate acyltransferase
MASEPIPRHVRLRRQLVWGWALSVVTVFLWPFLRVRVRGRENVPRTGAGLLIGNHVTFFDPATVPWASLRRAHGVGTDPILRVLIFGRMVPWLSVVPFAKGMKDKAAMVESQRRTDHGAMVMIFPEGDRCWTGRMRPVGAGIGRLAVRLGVPVVTCRQHTGHLQWPRWAKYPRWIPIEIEFLPPVTYPPDADPQEVTDDMVRRMSIDPEVPRASKWSLGWRLAHGLPAFLWACPACFTRDGLALDPADGDRGKCGSRGEGWRIDLHARMHPDSGGPDTSVDAAYESVLAHFGALPVEDADRFEAEGIVLEDEVAVGIVTRGVRVPAPLGTGPLQLRPDGLRFHPPEGPAKDIPFAEVKAVLTQMGGRLQVRTADENHELEPRGSSKLMWKHFLDRHLAAYPAAPERSAPAG